MKPTPTERIREVRQELERMVTEQREAQAVVARCEGELIDLEHEIELAPLNGVQLRKRAERLRDVRRERRAAKDQLETLAEIVRTLDKLGAIRAIDEAIRAGRAGRSDPRETAVFTSGAARGGCHQ